MNINNTLETIQIYYKIRYYTETVEELVRQEILKKGEGVMINSKVFKDIAVEIQIFPNIEQKKDFLFVLGALFLHIISLQKAAEVMEMDTEKFLNVLDLMGLEYSYLSENDISIEKKDW